MPEQRGADGSNQIDKFKAAASELGCDEDEAAFEDKLRRVAKHKPKPPEGGKDEKDEKDEAPE